MKIVKINGGLGNQMFQYAFAKSLESETGDEVYLDKSAYDKNLIHTGFELERIFFSGFKNANASDIKRLCVSPEGLLNRMRRKYFTKKSHFIDRKFNYQPEVFKLKGDRYFEGYWQSEKYFLSIEKKMREDFQFRLPLSKVNEELFQKIPGPISSIHIRRGDYLAHDNLNIVSTDYYMRAIKRMMEYGIITFLVFSDDIEYCKKIFDHLKDTFVFVNWNIGENTWQDMAMMSYCDSNIITNSSFSWWGAWLNNRTGKHVIAPKPWNRRELIDSDKYYTYTFGDVVPQTWERVDA